MANLCNYNLYATGTKESLESFSRMMNETGPRPYIWNPAYCSTLCTEPVETLDSGLFRQHFWAATRWSVEHAMVDRPDSDELVSLPSAARMLGLHIRVESEEPDCCFAERITITPDGKCDVKCVGYYEISVEDILEDRRMPTKEQFAEYLKQSIFDNEFLKTVDLDAAYSQLVQTGKVSLGGFSD